MSKVNVKENPNIAGDRLNILLLIFMYVLQCLPRAITEGIAITLQKRHISYAHQAGFSLISYSYCFKLLWSPIVDCVYSKRIGRRKTWIIPTQYLIGIFLLIISLKLDDWMGSEDGTRKPKVGLLGVIFFSCVCLASTQDVAVDGWALTMLKRRNVGHAGTCNNLGYAISMVLGYVSFIVLESKDFCNKFRFVPKDYGFVSFSGFTLFWSIVFIVASTIILLFKKEKSSTSQNDSDECRLGLKESYKCFWQIIKIGPIRELCLIILTSQVGMAPVNGVVRFKLIDAGISSANFALMTLPTLPFEIIIPFVLSRFIVGNLAMRYYNWTYIIRLMLVILYAVFIYLTPLIKDQDNMLPTWYYWVLLLVYNVDVLSDHFMYTALYAFFSHISDPRFGGMYLTLLSAVGSIAYRWPVAVCLWMLDPFTIRSCATVNGKGECEIVFDGFFIEAAVCLFVGVIWLYMAMKRIYKLEDMDKSAWLLKREPSESEDGELLKSAAASA